MTDFIQMFNYTREYDFSDEKLQDSVGILPPKLATWESWKFDGGKVQEKTATSGSTTIPMSRFVPLCKMTHFPAK